MTAEQAANRSNGQRSPVMQAAPRATFYNALCILMTARALDALVARTSMTPVRRAPSIAVALVLSEAMAMTQGWTAVVQDSGR
jgi:hypothetical protein